jgi:two-component system sensor histidine kinase HydH
MNYLRRSKNILKQSPILIVIFLSVALLMISSALIELQQSKKELYNLMSEESHSLLQSLIVSSQNILQANEHVELLTRERLLNNANQIKILYEQERISNEILQRISQVNNIYRIIVCNRYCKIIYSNYLDPAFAEESQEDLTNILTPIFQNGEDTVFFSYKKPGEKEGFHYVTALSTRENHAVVLDIKYMPAMKTGFGILLQGVVAENPNIIYTSLQDTAYILAASGNVEEFESINSSRFLSQALNDSLFMTRIAEFDSFEVFEAVHPFDYKGNLIGLFRLGLSLSPVDDINARIYRRLVFITFILIIFGSFLFSFIFIRQRYGILQREYKVIETYSGNIIENVSDAIIVYNEKEGIKILNRAAQSLFQLGGKKIPGKPLSDIFTTANLSELLKQEAAYEQFDYVINGNKRYLLVAKNSFSDSNGIKNFILVIRDLTELKLLEAEIQRSERLTAMGELAAGVAHEIRNPLNTISTIIQQLNKDFKPAKNITEYHELVQLVNGEVKRINQTVEEFLRFTRPEPVRPSEFHISALTAEIEKQYRHLLHEKKINLDMHLGWKGKVYWDFTQLKQVFINLIQNATEVFLTEGVITLSISKIDKANLQIIIEDNGPGMGKEVQERIFNLYYTTKAKGTGIGLSIVQKIIYEHGGTIRVESEKNKGTRFIIQLPFRVSSL